MALSLPRRSIRAALAVLALALPASLGATAASEATSSSASAPTAADTGDAALARGDAAAAVALWTREAADGSLEAMLQLGLAHDAGRGVETDRVRALLWYLQAAEAGHPDGQFNAAVMLDAGMGTGLRNVPEASVWYARAAANGQTRAQYALGLLYAAGEGVPRNPDLARHWFDAAAGALPAAAVKRATIAAPRAGDRRLEVPDVQAGEVVEISDWRFAELVWTAPPGPAGARYAVEIVSTDAARSSWTGPALRSQTRASSLSLDVEALGPELAWRVVQIDPDTRRFASSGWRRLGRSSLPLPDDDAPWTVADSRDAPRSETVSASAAE